MWTTNKTAIKQGHTGLKNQSINKSERNPNEVIYMIKMCSVHINNIKAYLNKCNLNPCGLAYTGKTQTAEYRSNRCLDDQIPLTSIVIV